MQKGARGWEQEGWGRGWGKGGQGGWNLYLNEVLNKTGIVTLTLVIGMHITRRNRVFGGVSPVFGRESPKNDITISQKRHNLAQKSPKTRCARDFT